MNEIVLNPEKFFVDIRGTLTRAGLPPLIFQRSHGKLQKKVGPIIPTNPQTRDQQINRIKFLAAIQQAATLDAAARSIYEARLKPHDKNKNWHHIFVRDFMKPNQLDAVRFGEGLFIGQKHHRPKWRFNEIQLDDAFFSSTEALPLNRDKIIARYPNINIDSLFQEAS